MKTRAGMMVCVMGLAVLLVLTGGCHHKAKTIEPGLGEETKKAPEPTKGTGLPDVELEKLLWSKDTGLQKVYFDYDSFALRLDALKTLSDNADKVKKAIGIDAKVLIQIEGHCDERGTQEYNMVLGEKRALAVRDHLIKLGASGDRLVTISYGKERPAADGHNEEAWKQNRRSEFNKAVAK